MASRGAEPFEQVAAALGEWSDRAWFVGGALRDQLLGRPVIDVDLVVTDDPRAAAQSVHRATGGDIFTLSDRFGTWRVLAEGGFQVDITPLRGSTIEQDLALRDFTINAMARQVSGDQLIDPHGGAGDAKAGVLRMVGDSAFREDPLRLLRLVRQAVTLGFAPDEQTRDAALRDAALAADPSAERIFAELIEIVGSRAAVDGVLMLDQLELLTVVLPELHALKGIEQTRYHHKDVFDHTLEVLERTVDIERTGYAIFGEQAGPLARIMAEPLADGLTRAGGLRWAALLHDIAKPETRRVFDNGRTGFPGHDKRGAEVVRVIGRRLHASEKLIAYVSALTREHMRLGFLVPEQPLSRRELHRYLVATRPVEVEVGVLSVADRMSTRGHKHELRIPPHVELALEITEAAIEFREHPPAPLLRGDELAVALGIETGPQIGELLALIAEAQYAGEVADADAAIALARASL